MCRPTIPYFIQIKQYVESTDRSSLTPEYSFDNAFLSPLTLENEGNMFPQNVGSKTQHHTPEHQNAKLHHPENLKTHDLLTTDDWYK